MNAKDRQVMMRRRLKLNKMTRERLAVEVGVTGVSIRNWELGETEPIPALAELWQMTLTRLEDEAAAKVAR